jgi:hypothetical protein
MKPALKRKGLLWIVSFLAAVTAAIWLFAPTQGPINRKAFSRIQLGMSKADVWAIMMLEPGDYSTDFFTSVDEESEGRSQSGRRLSWISNHAIIDVEFDEREQVCWKNLHIMETQSSIQQKLRRLWWAVKSWF